MSYQKRDDVDWGAVIFYAVCMAVMAAVGGADLILWMRGG